MTLTSELRDKIIQTHTMVEELKHQLVGNGQPGEIPKLKARLSWLERIAYTGLGALGVIVWAMEQKLVSLLPGH